MSRLSNKICKAIFIHYTKAGKKYISLAIPHGCKRIMPSKCQTWEPSTVPAEKPPVAIPSESGQWFLQTRNWRITPSSSVAIPSESGQWFLLGVGRPVSGRPQSQSLLNQVSGSYCPGCGSVALADPVAIPSESGQWFLPKEVTMALYSCRNPF